MKNLRRIMHLMVYPGKYRFTKEYDPRQKYQVTGFVRISENYPIWQAICNGESHNPVMWFPSGLKFFELKKKKHAGRRGKK